MTDPIIGNDADILLIQNNINSGTPYGFLLAELENERSDTIGEIVGRNISQTRTLRSSDKHLWVTEQDVVHFFSIICGASLTNPGSSNREQTEAEDLANLQQILTEVFEITLVTRFGAFSGLRADGHAVTITEYHNFTVAAVRLQTTGRNYTPIPYEIYQNCIFFDENNFPDNIIKFFDENEIPKGYWR